MLRSRRYLKGGNDGHDASPNRPSPWRRATAGRRALPDFIIAGTQRGGTTSLYNYLVQHPLIVPALWKEVHYFDRNAHYRQGLDWFRAHFPTRGRLDRVGRRHPDWNRPALTLEATPEYMYRRRAVKRMGGDLPGIRLVIVLRNPVDRAYSSFQNRLRKGREPDSFETGIRAELEWLERDARLKAQGKPGSPRGGRPRSYLSRGLYAEQLERLFQHYPRERVLVCRSEDMFDQPQPVVDTILSFLGLPPHPLANVAGRNRSVYEQPIDAGLRQEMAEFFTPHNQRLYELLARDFQWEVKVAGLKAGA